jgi:hypothetical protein
MFDIDMIFILATSVCAFMIGKLWSNWTMPPEYIIENTIEYLIDNDFIRAKRLDDGEWEISKIDE